MTEETNYDVSLGYRANPAIANSDLKYLHSPQLFHLNKQRKLEEETKTYQSKGTLIDQYLLRNSIEEFNENFIREPDFKDQPTSGNQYEFVELIMEEEDPMNLDKDLVTMLHDQCYKRSSEASAWKMYTDFKPYIAFQIESKSKQVYSNEDWQQLLDIEKNCRAHKLINRFMFEPKKGDQVFKHLQIIGMEKWGVTWKGELDLAVVNHVDKIIYNIDLKSSAKAITNFNYYYAKKYNYKRQQALYRDLLTWWLVEQSIIPKDWHKEWKIKTRCIVVKKLDLNEVYCVPIPFKVLNEGTNELKEAARKIRFYQENGWRETISYRKNDGLEVMDWEEYIE